MTATNKDSRSIGELLSELASESRTLFRQEVELAKTEISQKVTRITSDAVLMAVGGFLAFGGFLCLLAAAVAGLAEIWPVWLSALVVGLGAGVIGAVVLMSAKKDISNNGVVPKRTVKSIEGDGRWLKEQVTSS